MTIEKLYEAALLRMGKTPEERLAAARERTRKFNEELRKQYRCHVCGVDTLNYSHTFDCKFRGL